MEHKIHGPHFRAFIAIDAHCFSPLVGGFSSPVLTARVKNFTLMSPRFETRAFQSPSFFVGGFSSHLRISSAARRSLSARSPARLLRVAARAVARLPQEREQ